LNGWQIAKYRSSEILKLKVINEAPPQNFKVTLDSNANQHNGFEPSTSLKSVVINRGCATTPTNRSVKARVISNMFGML
jgi:hypothetical protein